MSKTTEDVDLSSIGATPERVLNFGSDTPLEPD